jgi:hypothetical protein
MGLPSSMTTGLAVNPSISTNYPGRSIRFGIKEPFPSSTGRLRITFPSSLQILYLGTLSFINTTINNTISLSFSSVSTFDITSSNALNLTSLTYITPPSSRPFNITINSEHV